MTFRSGLIQHNGQTYRVTNCDWYAGQEITRGTVEVQVERRLSKWDACPSKVFRSINPRGNLGRQILERAFRFWGESY